MSKVQSYQLYIHLSKCSIIEIGMLGTFEFPAGEYIYTGSAKRNMEARIQRHLSKSKKLKWHIDYLLANPNAQVVEIKRFSDSECSINQKSEGEILIPRFGASDCKNRCGSHLKYRKK